MAIDKAIDSAVLEANLKAVADAIREKGGTSDTLAFPSGFADAIAAIESGREFKTGSIMYEANTACKDTYSNTKKTYTIQHNCGYVPNLFLIYTEEDILENANKVTRSFHSATLYYMDINDVDTYYTAVKYCDKTSTTLSNSGGNNGGYLLTQNTSAGSNCLFHGLTDTYINVVGYIGSTTSYFLGGVEYKWIAVAI